MRSFGNGHGDGKPPCGCCHGTDRVPDPFGHEDMVWPCCRQSPEPPEPFLACVSDEVVFADDDLAVLLAHLDAGGDTSAHEDIAVWHGPRLVCIVLAKAGVRLLREGGAA
jgi:hypothetical protein